MSDARSLRPESDGAPSCRQRQDRAVQLAARARPGRDVRAAPRGHRRGAVHRRLGRGHPRGPALARASTGTKAPTAVASSDPTARRSGCRSIAPTPIACATPATRTTASVPRPTSRRRARWPCARAARRSTPGTCRGLDPAASRARVDAGEPAALRFRVPAETAVTFTDLVRGPITTDIAMIGDFVLLRQNGLPAYNFAVVVDDVAMRISLVVRGEDHVPNTPRQCLIYRALGESRRSLRTSRWCSARITRRCPSGTARRASPSSGPAGILPEACATISCCSDGRPATTRRSCRSTNSRAASASRTYQERRGVRPRQARVDEPPLPQGSRAGADRGAAGAAPGGRRGVCRRAWRATSECWPS